MKVTVETITPEKAAAWLPKFTRANRNMRDAKVEQYAQDMKDGNWRLTGETIKFNGSRGMDGQHRLAACLLAGVPFRSAVAWDVSSDAHVAIDTGVARTMSDELKFRGEKDTARLAATLSHVWRYDNDVFNRRGHPSRQTLLAVLNSNPDLMRRSVRKTIGNKVGILSTALAAVHYLASRDHSIEDADGWLARVNADVGHEEGDPTLAYRRFAVNTRNTAHSRVRADTWVALGIKSFNAYVLGDKVANLRWRRGGHNPEPFPEIVKPEA